MKVRTGLVSNSSSASFIVAFDKEESLKGKLVIDVDLSEYADIISNKEELLNHYISYYDTEEELLKDEYDGEKYKRELQIIESGKKVAIIDVSDDTGEMYESVLCNKGLNDFKFNGDDVEVIEGEGGY